MNALYCPTSSSAEKNLTGTHDLPRRGARDPSTYTKLGYYEKFAGNAQIRSNLRDHQSGSLAGWPNPRIPRSHPETPEFQTEMRIARKFR